MNRQTEKAYDFSVRIVELARYLKDEGKEFPLIHRLLECGAGIGISLRLARSLLRTCQDSFANAAAQAEEARYLLELMVKTGFLTELQSKPLLADCTVLIEEAIEPRLNKSS